MLSYCLVGQLKKYTFCGVKKVKQMKETFLMEEKKDDLPLPLKRRITDEILQTLRGLDANASATEQRGEGSFDSLSK